MKLWFFLVLTAAVVVLTTWLPAPIVDPLLEVSTPAIVSLPRLRPVLAAPPAKAQVKAEEPAPSRCETAGKELARVMEEAGSADGIEQALERTALTSACGDAPREIQERVRKLAERCKEMEGAGPRKQFACLQGTVALLQRVGGTNAYR